MWLKVLKRPFRVYAFLIIKSKLAQQRININIKKNKAVDNAIFLKIICFNGIHSILKQQVTNSETDKHVTMLYFCLDSSFSYNIGISYPHVTNPEQKEAKDITQAKAPYCSVGIILKINMLLIPYKTCPKEFKKSIWKNFFSIIYYSFWQHFIITCKKQKGRKNHFNKTINNAPVQMVHVQ